MTESLPPLKSLPMRPRVTGEAWSFRRAAPAILRLMAVVGLAAFAVATPGFLSGPSIVSLLTTISFMGCIAVGMTLIAISGNVMSFSLGATTGASAIAFVYGLNAGGVAVGLVCALAFGATVSGAQGAAIGLVRANPIIVSIAGFALIMGLGDAVAQHGAVYAANPTAYAALRGQIGLLPYECMVLIALAIAVQLMLGFTAFGRQIFMLGSSRAAAEASGIGGLACSIGVYVVAGLCAAVGGILLAVRYDGASMAYGAGYDYDAVAAVLVGGTPLSGGRGSVLRTLAGVLAIAVVQAIVLLRGFRQEWQYLFTGLIVFAVIVLQARRAEDR